jgi:L-serine dehydratase
MLPILTPDDMSLPFGDCEEMLAYNQDKNLSLADLAFAYESARGGIGKREVLEKMIDIVRIIRTSVSEGLKGTSYADRILGYQSGGFMESLEAGKLLDIGMLNRMIAYISALMEVKSSLGVIVAAPTAGSCGGLPGAVLGAADALDGDETAAAKALMAAGMVGIFITKFATFAAEVGGCQAECGAGSGMAAGALVTLMGGSTEKAVAAASMALQNSFGMVCDPVANRVEVPCLGKNIMAISNAVACANLALAGFDPVVPLDEVIQTMDRVGKSIPFELRCTALGGLSVTETSKIIKEQLEGNFSEKKN